jgi:hypothetical protein
VGAIVAVLTLVSNKPYLGWPQHTWDPMLLGILLTGVALFIRRWLAGGPGGIRSGFTAARLSGKDKQWMNASSAVLGLVTPQSITPSPQTTRADVTSVGELREAEVPAAIFEEHSTADYSWLTANRMLSADAARGLTHRPF